MSPAAGATASPAMAELPELPELSKVAGWRRPGLRRRRGQWREQQRCACRACQNSRLGRTSLILHPASSPGYHERHSRGLRVEDRRLRISFLFLALALSSGVGAQQQSQPTFRTGVTLVTVDVSVLDG